MESGVGVNGGPEGVTKGSGRVWPKVEVVDTGPESGRTTVPGPEVPEKGK